MFPLPRIALAIVAVGLVVLTGGGDRAPVRVPRPDDPALVAGSQWNLTAIGAPRAWRRATGRGTRIAIVDSGIDLTHADLQAHIVGSTDCIGSAGDPARCRGTGGDDDGHGTHVAGIAAAVTDNGIGVAGVAPDARLLAVRVLADACGSPDCPARGAALDVAAGVRWSTAHGASVINLSLGAADDALAAPALAAAIREAWQHGVIVVAAAGNRTVTAGLADLPVIVVTAVDRRFALASYAAGVGRARWALAAPGGESGDTAHSCRAGGRPDGILSATWDPSLGPDRYGCLAGTSMAAPHVAGAAAVLRSLGLTPEQTVDRLLATARDLGRPGPDPVFGAGLLALDRAMVPEAAQRASTAIPVDAAVAASAAPPVAGTIAPRPQPPPLLPTMLAGSVLSLSGAAAIMLARHMWAERGGS